MSNYCKSGRLYKVTKEFYGKVKCAENPRDLFSKTSVGEIVEFRYPSGANFRTVEGVYLYCSAEEFEKNTEPFGQIWENVRWRNKNKLRGILEEMLYSDIEETK